MKRRPPRRAELVEMPASLRSFDFAEWHRPGDHNPDLPHWAHSEARRRWTAAQTAWLVDHGISPLDELLERRAEARRAAAEAFSPPDRPAW